MSDDETEPERPHRGGLDEPDLGSLLVYAILRTAGQLGPLVSAGLRRQRLTGAQLNVLLALQAGPPDGLLMTEIGRLLVVTKANVTGLIDRLEAQGLVARRAHRDRRARWVVLTAKARSLLARTLPDHRRHLGALTACLPAAEKRRVIQSLSHLRRGLRQLARPRP
jgi:MarR family transcriptional regulator, 2-MHQ and catechol-resistance regulon repressor